jgi:hypothetical protein
MSIKSCYNSVCHLTGTSQCSKKYVGYLDGIGVTTKVKRNRYYCPSCRERLDHPRDGKEKLEKVKPPVFKSTTNEKHITFSAASLIKHCLHHRMDDASSRTKCCQCHWLPHTTVHGKKFVISSCECCWKPFRSSINDQKRSHRAGLTHISSSSDRINKRCLPTLHFSLEDDMYGGIITSYDDGYEWEDQARIWNDQEEEERMLFLVSSSKPPYPNPLAARSSQLEKGFAKPSQPTG